MARCKHCGKKGFFLHLDQDGFCSDCARLEKINQEYLEAQKSFEILLDKVNDTQQLYDTTRQKAIDDAQVEIDSLIATKQKVVSKLTSDIANLREEYETAESKAQQAQKSFESKSNKGKVLVRELNAIKSTIETYFNANEWDVHYRLPELDEEIIQALTPTVELKLHCMDVKQLKKEYTSIQKQIKEVLAKYESRYTTKANITIYRLMVLALEAELQNILFDLRFGKLEDSLENIKVMTQKYISIAAEGNKSIAATIIKFVGELEYLFCEAVKVEYEYYSQKERIKEEQRALREQMKQEAEERKILEQQKKQVEKEESKYRNEMTSLQEQLEKAQESTKVDELNKRLAELQQQLDAVAEKKEEIVSRQHGKAGYVYVISNKGSFGDDVFKIGMTRRLDPQDRINELGNASVPFPFDVHSFIFSDDAVDLEHSIHVTLNKERVNKVNLRKEFFRISIDKLEDLVYELQPTAEFNKTMLAEQYNQSISLSEPLNDFVDEFDSSEDDEDAE